jgi:dCTP deaminase
MLLNDEQLVELDPNVIKGLDRSGDLYDAKSPIQPASIDLHIGDIFLPEIRPGEPGSIQSPLSFHSLLAGHTAIVQTKEDLDLPSDLAAIGFPPSTEVSFRGLLMTNPGHVDPGYKGRMKFTVINMGRESFHLKSGDVIVTLLFFRLDQPPRKSYPERNPKITGGVTEEQLSRLAKDFLDFQRRAEDIVKQAERKAIWWTAGVPIVAALIGVIGSFAAAYVFTASRVHDIETRMVRDKASLDIDINNLKNKLDDRNLDKRIEELERLAKKTVARSPKP